MICCFNPSHHTGSDPEICFQLAAFRVSIHAPYAGSDCIGHHKTELTQQFQSTPPMQGATSWTSETTTQCITFQSTPPMQGATHEGVCRIRRNSRFQSTPPMQGATQKYLRDAAIVISFNPRPLCRERLKAFVLSVICALFQSTPPMQGATLPGYPIPT